MIRKQVLHTTIPVKVEMASSYKCEPLSRYDRLLPLNHRLIANDTLQAVMTMENIQQAYGENVQTSSDGNAETCYMHSSL